MEKHPRSISVTLMITLLVISSAVMVAVKIMRL
jgi:hypothetical protein